MKRPANSIPTDGTGDPIPAAVAEYDSRIEEAAVRERRGFIFGCAGAAFGLSGAGALTYALVRGSPPPLLAEMCRGDVLAVRSVAAPTARPAQQDIAADLKAWVRGAREALTDVHALSRQAFKTYDMTRRNSQAEAKLRAYHNQNKLNEIAATRTIYVKAQTAFPQAGVADSNTWLCEWRETTTGRDGVVMAEAQWRMVVSFVLRPPTTADDLQRNPHGLFVESFDWEVVRPDRNVVAERGR